MLYQALVPSFINSVSIPESQSEGKWKENDKILRENSESKDRGRLSKIVCAPEPGLRGRCSCNTHTYSTQTHAAHILLFYPAQTSDKQGPVPHQWLKRQGAQLTLVLRRGRANAASPPPISSHPSAAAVSAFIVPASSARHLTFNSSNAWPSPGPRDTALVYSSDRPT